MTERATQIFEQLQMASICATKIRAHPDRAIENEQLGHNLEKIIHRIAKELREELQLPSEGDMAAVKICRDDTLGHSGSE